MRIYRLASELQFKDHLLDSYSGQSNMRLIAERDGKVCGGIDYVVFGDEISVSMIEVDESERRKGVGTALLKELQRLYPDNHLEMGWFTEDGAKLWNSIPKKIIKNDEYYNLSNEKENLLKRQKMLTDYMNKWFESGGNDGKRETMIATGDELNEISDRLDEIDHLLRDMKSEQVFLS